MLHEFVSGNREELVRRCRAKVEKRSVPPPTPAELEHGIPDVLDRLIDALRRQSPPGSATSASTARHGRDLRPQGFTASQVVRDCVDLCQSIAELALDLNAPISAEDFRALNRCLDEAIAAAVAECGRDGQPLVDIRAAHDDARMGFLAHEIRNLVGTASVAFELLRTGDVGIGGSTGRVLQRSLAALRDLVNRSLSELRLRHDIRNPTRFPIGEFIAELAPAAALDAGARGLRLDVVEGDPEAVVDADRPILAATVANLLQNAFKFTRPGSTVTLRSRATSDRVVIEVEDECGGLLEGNVDVLFEPFEQRAADRTGLGLGLAISRSGVEANNGRIYARNLPDHGCIFTIDLPRVALGLPSVIVDPDVAQAG